MKKGKIVLLVVVAFLCIGVISGVIHNLTGNTPESSSKKETQSDTNENGAETEPETSKEVLTDFLTCPVFSSEQNTSAMVDEIASIAKDNASNLTDEQAMEIIKIIREAEHNFYNGPEEMEKFMWYGYLLDYKYEDSDPRSALGTDLCQAIKYVYRGAETVLDDSTHENLLQIDKDLENIE